MKKLAAIAITFILLTSFVGGGGRGPDAGEGHSSGRPSVSEGTEDPEGTLVLEDNIETVQVDSEIKELVYFRLLWNLYKEKRNAGMTKQQIGRLQKKKLEKLLLFAYDHSPYYRKAFEAQGITWENIKITPLERFPMLDKGILMEHFDELVTDRSLKQEELLQFDKTAGDNGKIYIGKYHVVHSSGSTGTPSFWKMLFTRKYFVWKDCWTISFARLPKLLLKCWRRQRNQQSG